MKPLVPGRPPTATERTIPLFDDLAREGSWRPICGIAAMGEKGVPTGKVCRACLIEVSRLRGLLR